MRTPPCVRATSEASSSSPSPDNRNRGRDGSVCRSVCRPGTSLWPDRSRDKALATRHPCAPPSCVPARLGVRTPAPGLVPGLRWSISGPDRPDVRAFSTPASAGASPTDRSGEGVAGDVVQTYGASPTDERWSAGKEKLESAEAYPPTDRNRETTPQRMVLGSLFHVKQRPQDQPTAPGPL